MREEHPTPDEVARQAVERHAADKMPEIVRKAEAVSDIAHADMPAGEKLSAIDSLSHMADIDSRAAKREVVIAESKRQFYNKLRTKVGKYTVATQRYGRATRRP